MHRASNGTKSIREHRIEGSWIIELVSTGWRDGKPFHHVHVFITTPGPIRSHCEGVSAAGLHPSSLSSPLMS